MKRKSKPPKKPSTHAGAADAQCSKGLAHRLMKHGHTREEIGERVRERKTREAELELPTAQVNGHAAGIPSYAESRDATRSFMRVRRG